MKDRSIFFRSAILVLFISIALLGCGGGGGGDDGSPPDDPTDDPNGLNPQIPELIRSSLERERSPQISPSEMETLTEGNNRFAAELFRNFAGNRAGNIPGNLVCSPYSLSLSLAMTYAGARNETRRGMADALHFFLPGELLHPAFNLLDLSLSEQGDEEAEIILDIENSIWIQKGSRFLAEYLDTLALHYDAGLMTLDYTAPDTARTAINDWMAVMTGGRIEEILSPGALLPDTRLVITNATFFKALWKDPFEEEMTEVRTFFPPEGEPVDVPFMNQKNIYRYLSKEGFQALSLPYAGGTVEMLLLMAESGGTDALVAQFTPEWLDGITREMAEKVIRIYLPRFEYAATCEGLEEMLSGMGMGLAFTTEADFSGMTGGPDLMLSSLVHKAFISVDEKGTEASAGSGVIVGPTSPGEVYATVTFDRPFIFLIRETETGTILFMGRLLHPLQ